MDHSLYKPASCGDRTSCTQLAGCAAAAASAAGTTAAAPLQFLTSLCLPSRLHLGQRSDR